MRDEAVIKSCWSDFLNNESTSAYYKLYEHYYAYLVFWGIKRKFPADRVKDVINDVFLYLWERRMSLQHIQHPHNYIITFFMRSLYKGDQYARLHVNIIEPIEEYAPANLIEPACDKDLMLKEKEQQLFQLIHKRLEQLGPKQKQIIYQKFYLGLSYEEISQANHVSINTVYNTVYTAMDKLRQQLSKNMSEALPLAALSLAVTFFGG